MNDFALLIGRLPLATNGLPLPAAGFCCSTPRRLDGSPSTVCGH